MFVRSSPLGHAHGALLHVALLQVCMGQGCNDITVMTATDIMLLTCPVQCLVKHRHHVKPCIEILLLGCREVVQQKLQPCVVNRAYS